MNFCLLLNTGKKMCKNVGENIGKNVSRNYSQKRLDHAKKSATDVLKTFSKRVIQKRAETTCDIMGNKKLLIKLEGFQTIHKKMI